VQKIKRDKEPEPSPVTDHDMSNCSQKAVGINRFDQRISRDASTPPRNAASKDIFTHWKMVTEADRIDPGELGDA